MNNSMSINSTTQIEIDKFLTILRTIKTDNEKLNSYISIKETELFIKNFPTNKTLGIDGFTGQFNHSNKLSGNRRERYTSNHFMRLTFL